MKHPLQSVYALEEYEELVQKIRECRPESQQMLFKTFGRGLRFLARQECPGHVGDCISETLYEVIKGIRRGELTAAEALPGYVHSAYKRVSASCHDGLAGLAERRGNWDIVALDAQLVHQNRVMGMKVAMQRLDNFEKSLLRRLYVDGQSREDICQATGLRRHQLRKILESTAMRIGLPPPLSRII